MVSKEQGNNLGELPGVDGVTCGEKRWPARVAAQVEVVSGPIAQ
jgi:hypothetical protein